MSQVFLARQGTQVKVSSFCICELLAFLENEGVEYLAHLDHLDHLEKVNPSYQGFAYLAHLELVAHVAYLHG
jgi:hypothetical protein